MDNMPIEQQPKVYEWMPPPGYYEGIAQSNVNAPVNFIGRMAIGLYGFVRYGRSKIVTSPGFDAMAEEVAQGNVIVASIHRSGLDTVLLPNVLERVDIHHSRPMSKLELFQKRLRRLVMHKLGGFAVDKENRADIQGLSIAEAGILRRADLGDGKRHGFLRRKAKNGAVTIYAESTRVHNDVLRVNKIKGGVAFAAIENNSLIVPVGFAGLSSEKVGEKPKKVDGKRPKWPTAARDKRTWFGLGGPRLVFSIGDPFRLPALSEEELKDSRAKTRAVATGRTIIIEAMRAELENAIKVRGSSLEEDFPQPEL